MFEFPKPKPLIEVEQRKPEFYLKDFLPIPKSALTMLSAPGGSGKSFLSIQLAIRLAQNENCKILLWLSEDPSGVTKHRAEEILNKIPDVGNHLRNIDIVDDMPQHLTHQNYMEYKELFIPYNLIVLDPLIAFYGGEENSNTQARYFMNMLNRIARDNMQSFVIVHHSTKANKDQESKSRGAGAFIDTVRLGYEIKTIQENTLEREIIITKDNFGVRQIIGESKKITVLPYEVAFIKDDQNPKEQQQPKKRSLWEVIR